MEIVKRERGTYMYGSFSLRVTPDMYLWLKGRMDANKVSLNREINDLLESARRAVESGLEAKESCVM